MKRIMKKNQGFTLIELMIVVVIIGILAAVAIPQFLKYQLKSKTTEATRSLGAIKTNQEAFSARWNAFGLAQQLPTGDPGPTAQEWVPTSNVGFDLLGFAPSGNVYYQYATITWDGTDVQTEMNSASCSLDDATGNVSLSGGADGTVTVNNSEDRVGSDNVILMYARGNLDGEAGEFGCFGLGNASSDMIPMPAGTGDSVF